MAGRCAGRQTRPLLGRPRRHRQRGPMQLIRNAGLGFGDLIALSLQPFFSSGQSKMLGRRKTDGPSPIKEDAATMARAALAGRNV